MNLILYVLVIKLSIRLFEVFFIYRICIVLIEKLNKIFSYLFFEIIGFEVCVKWYIEIEVICIKNINVMFSVERFKGMEDRYILVVYV